MLKKIQGCYQSNLECRNSVQKKTQIIQQIYGIKRAGEMLQIKRKLKRHCNQIQCMDLI